MKTLSFVLASLCFWAANAESAQSVMETASTRLERRMGAYVGIAGEPAPALAGINVAYNFTDFLRASVGGGSVEILGAKATVIGAGVRGFMPGWSLSPTLGVHYAHVISEGLTYAGFGSTGGGHVSLSLGADYQSRSGFNAGLGYSLSLRSGVPGSMYANLGWFFDLGV